MKRDIVRIAVFVLCLIKTIGVTAQNPKGKYGTFALTNASIQTVTKGVLDNATVVIRNGKIEAVGKGVTVPQEAEVIDCKGLWIYPGLIDGGTHLGLVEVSSDQRTKDYNEVGDVVPQMKALSAVNPSSVLIPVTRVSGVTTVIATPEGELMPGTAALINLYGYTPEQMYAGFQGVVINFPNTGRKGFWDKRTDDDIKKAAEKALAKLNEVWEKAGQYHKIDSATKSSAVGYYPELQALLPVVRGEQSLLIEVNASKDIEAALKWVKERRIKKVVFTGVAEGWRVANEIAKAGIPVVAGPVLALPSREYDRYDKAYANPGLMHKAGVKVALKTTQAENVRNLPYHAAFAATYGLGKEQALKAVTIIPAEIFGVANRLGSIEVGKDATLLISDGDPFETKTNIKHVFIDGWKIPMVSRQTQLYDEFLQRDPGIKKSK